MIEHRLARTSAEEVGVRVVALGWDGEPFDPSAYPVALAAVPFVDPLVPPEPTSPLWRPGTWGGVGVEWYAIALFGPGSTGGALDPGRYRPWVRITAPPATPIIRARFTLVVI